MSASVSSEIREESLRTGCDDFLAKPIQIEGLLDCLRHHLHLTWIYENPAISEAQEQPAGELIVPPREMLQELLELAKRGYINDIRDVLARIEASNPRFSQFVHELKQFADHLQCKQIREYLLELQE